MVDTGFQFGKPVVFGRPVHRVVTVTVNLEEGESELLRDVELSPPVTIVAASDRKLQSTGCGFGAHWMPSGSG